MIFLENFLKPQVSVEHILQYNLELRIEQIFLIGKLFQKPLLLEKTACVGKPYSRIHRRALSDSHES